MRGMHSICKSHSSVKQQRTISRENMDRIERDKRLTENALKKKEGKNGAKSR